MKNCQYITGRDLKEVLRWQQDNGTITEAAAKAILEMAGERIAETLKNSEINKLRRRAAILASSEFEGLRKKAREELAAKVKPLSDQIDGLVATSKMRIADLHEERATTIRSLKDRMDALYALRDDMPLVAYQHKWQALKFDEKVAEANAQSKIFYHKSAVASKLAHLSSKKTSLTQAGRLEQQELCHREWELKEWIYSADRTIDELNDYIAKSEAENTTTLQVNP